MEKSKTYKWKNFYFHAQRNDKNLHRHFISHKWNIKNHNKQRSSSHERWGVFFKKNMGFNLEYVGPNKIRKKQDTLSTFTTWRNRRLCIQANILFNSKHRGLCSRIISRAKTCKPGNKDVNRCENKTLPSLL